jgi:hypothetical protein
MDVCLVYTPLVNRNDAYIQHDDRDKTHAEHPMPFGARDCQDVGMVQSYISSASV